MGVIGYNGAGVVALVPNPARAYGGRVASGAPDGYAYSCPVAWPTWPDPATFTIQAPPVPDQPYVSSLYATTDDNGEALSISVLWAEVFGMSVTGAIYQPDGALVAAATPTVCANLLPGVAWYTLSLPGSPVVLPDGPLILLAGNYLLGAPLLTGNFWNTDDYVPANWFPRPAALTIREHVGVSEPSPRMAHVLGIRENVGVADRHKDEAACFGRHVRPTWMEGD